MSLLWQVRAGFLAIEFYSEDKGHWRQAHMQVAVLLSDSTKQLKFMYMPMLILIGFPSLACEVGARVFCPVALTLY